MRDNEKQIGEAATVLRPHKRNKIFLICDHASNNIPTEYGDLGLTTADRSDHIAWDIGAADVIRVLSENLDAPAVLNRTSRLVIDSNRQPELSEVIPTVTHGVRVPGNEELDEQQREARFAHFYHPYHQAIDGHLCSSDAAVLVSIHSFSHDLDRISRNFDIGLLFDEFEPLAVDLAKKLESHGMRVRLNEPYSGRSHVRSSAQRHGRRYQLPNYEIEINQRLIASRTKAIAFGNRLAPVVRWLGEVATA